MNFHTSVRTKEIRSFILFTIKSKKKNKKKIVGSQRRHLIAIQNIFFEISGSHFTAHSYFF